MTHPYVRESSHPDCEPSMRFRATLPDGTMRYRGTLVEALAELPGPDFGWRDVRHETPPVDLEVIAWKDGGWYRASYDGRDSWSSDDGLFGRPSHWMPTPPAPR